MDQFEGMEEVKTNTFKFGKPGDWFRGTLTANDREVPNKLSAKKEMQRVLEFKMKGGSFHPIVNNVPQDAAVEVKDGDFMSVFAKPVIWNQVRNAKLGQVVGMHFAEERASTQPGMNATKVIKVYLGAMDPDYKGETSSDIDLESEPGQ